MTLIVYLENGHLINMRYENVTFLCGKSYRCLGNFSARDRVWTIDCDDVTFFKKL